MVDGIPGGDTEFRERFESDHNSIRRAAHSKRHDKLARPRETTIDLVGSYARFPSIGGVANSSDSFADFSQSLARLGDPSSYIFSFYSTY